MSTRWMTAALGVAIFAIAAPVSAELLVYDGFDYSPGPLQTNAGGEGNWEGQWYSPTYIVETGSLTIPNLPFDVVGGHTSGDSTANRDITEISSTVPGTYYVSYLCQRTGYVLEETGGQWADFYLRDGFTQVVNGGITSRSDFHIRFLGADSDGSGGQLADSSDPFFVVYKIVIGDTPNSNSLSMSWYSNGSNIPINEPAVWGSEITGQGDLAGDFNKFTLWAGTNFGFSAHYDELRIATTYSEAVPVTASLEGDLNKDGFVGLDDLDIVLGAWNQSVPPADPAADPSGDGFVGLDDLDLVLNNWNMGTPPVSAVVPEPAMVSVIALSLLGAINQRRA